METQIISPGQTWWDVGIELSGAWEAGIDLAFRNGLSMTDAPPFGTEVRAIRSYNRPMEVYCHTYGVSPATLDDNHQVRYQIFHPTFNTTFR